MSLRYFVLPAVLLIPALVMAANVIPNDPNYDASAYASIDLPTAWETTTGSPSVTVAVIDDAVEITHPDLAGNIHTSSYDVERRDNDPSPELCSQGPETRKEAHGTGVAGVVGAVGNNGVGIAGVNWKVSLLAIRVGCMIGSSQVLEAIRYAVNQGARIINASFASYERYDQATREGISRLLEDNDALLIVSAANTHGDNDYSPVDPANIDSPNIIVVAASDNTGKLTHWSHYGVTSVDLAAPGVKILTTGLDNTYRRQTGTSYSAPMVAGVAALLLSARPDLSARELRAILLASVTPLANGRATSRQGLPLAKLVTDGVVNAAAAMQISSQPRPLPILHAIEVDDATLGNGNGVIDSDERFELVLTIEDAWPNSGLGALDARLTSTADEVNIENAQQLLTFTSDDKGRSLASARFRVAVSEITAHRRFSFDLHLEGTGANLVRSFELEAGPLRNAQTVSGVLQQNEFDDFQTFTLDVPAQARVVVFELQHEGVDDGRIPDLVVARNTRPVLQMNTTANDVSRGGRFSYYRATNGSLEGTWRAVVYHRMLGDNTLAGQPKAFSLRGCYLTEEQLAVTPQVEVLADKTVVEPGARVNLKGMASLGSNRFFWWELAADTGAMGGVLPRLEGDDTLEPYFVAPDSGSFTITLNISDENCRQGSASVTIQVQEASDLKSGFTLEPRAIDIVEGVDLRRFVQAIVNDQVNGMLEDVVEFRLVDGPPGVSLENDFLIWPNAGPAGTYFLTFVARTRGGEAQYAQMKITVRDSSGNTISASGMSRTASGCSMGGPQGFDPSLPVLLLFSLLYVLRERKVCVALH